MPKTQHPTMEEMDAALHQTLDQVDALKAENARLQDKLDGFMEAFERGGSLGILQMIGADKTLPIEIRMRAAGLAVPYEKPKLSMTATVQHRPLFDILEEAHQRRRKVIEAPPAQPATVLNEGQGEHGAWHPLDSDKGDPAA
jgi:hypothetical protein